MNYKITIGLGISLMASLGAMDALVKPQPVMITQADIEVLKEWVNPSMLFILEKEAPCSVAAIDQDVLLCY